MDIISNADLSSLRDFHKEMNADVTLLTSGRGVFRRLLFDVQNNLRGWHNRNTGEFRPETSASLSGLTEHAFSGIYMVSAHGVADIRRYARESGREAFPVMDWLLAGRGGVTIKEHYVPERTYRYRKAGDSCKGTAETRLGPFAEQERPIQLSLPS